MGDLIMGVLRWELLSRDPKLRNLPPIDDFVANAPSWANGPALYGVN